MPGFARETGLQAACALLTGRAMLTCHHGGDLAKVRRVGHFSVFGAPVRVGGASTASKI